MSRPASLAEVAARRAARLDQPLRKPLSEFLDAFYAAGGAQAAMLADEPAAAIPTEEAAYLAATAEHLCALYTLPLPRWVEGSRYFLDQASWPDTLGRNSETIHFAESPTAFRRRFIFTEAQPLRRKGGPRPVVR